jgi:integrase
MASGCVVTYQGRRGRVFRIKFTDEEGRQHMETVGPALAGWTRRKAEKVLRDRLSDVERGKWRKPKPVTFADFAQTWLEEGSAGDDWKPNTVKAYRSVVRRLTRSLGSKRLAELRPRDVAAYIADRTRDGWAPATIHRDVSVLHDILSTAVRQELVDRNPAQGAERPRVRQRRWRILKPAEVPLVARSFTDPVARVVFLMLVLTGVRRSELTALRWRDVDLVENVLRVADSKTEDGVRSIALPPSLAEELWQHRRASAYQGDDDRVFCHAEKGTAYRGDEFAEHFRAALKKAGITDHMRPFHDLRHTAITNDAAAGSSPIAVMTKAGHTDMRTTKRYLHLAGVVFRDEAEALERRLGLGLSTETSTEPSDRDRPELSRVVA